jgi:hypothetical protein
MLSIEVGSGPMGDKELAAVGFRPGIGHGQNSRPVVFKGRIELIRKLITRAACTVTQGISSLDHETRYYPVKGKAVIKRLPSGCPHLTFSQGDKITNCHGGLLKFQTDDNIPLGGADPGKKTVPKGGISGSAKGRFTNEYQEQNSDTNEKISFQGKKTFFYIHSFIIIYF